MGWHISGIKCNGQMAALDEVRIRNRWYRDKPSGMSHSFCVLGRAEDRNAVVWRSESFDTLISLLAVIQTRCHAVYSEVGILDELGFGPLPGLNAVVGFDVAIDWLKGHLQFNNGIR